MLSVSTISRGIKKNSSYRGSNTLYNTFILGKTFNKSQDHPLNEYFVCHHSLCFFSF